MPYTYAIPDLHGRADLLEVALERIADHAGGGIGTIVVLGDYVDKGPQSRQVIDRLIAGVNGGWKLVCLKGNHDAMMLTALHDPDACANWLAKGGAAALASYGAGDEALAKDAIPLAHQAWLENLSLMHIDRYRVFVHAGLDATVGLKKQVEKTLLWKRYKPGEQARGYRGRHVVHGHDSGAGNPLVLPGRTNLDTLAWRTGRLVIGVFDDGIPGGALDYIEVLGPPVRRVATASAAAPDPAKPVDRPPGLWQRLRRLIWFGS